MIKYCTCITREGMDDVDVLTREEVLKEYWDYWSNMMRIRNKPEHLITEDNCVDDWKVIHWAWEIHDGH